MLLVQLLYCPMVLTIDTSALLAVLLNEKHKQAIIEITKNHDLQAPASLDAEIGNALSAMFKRERLKLTDAHEALVQFYDIPIRRTPLRLKEATKMAFNHDIYAYDAYVLDCARQHHSPLLSLDHKLLSVGRKLGLNILEVLK